MAIAKPAYGQPCNGCGGCCQATLCPLGSMVFKMQRGPCPALRFDIHSQRSACGLVLEPEMYGPPDRSPERLASAAKLLIGTQFGCDAQIAGEPDDPEFRRRLHREGDAARRSGKIARAIQAWGF